MSDPAVVICGRPNVGKSSLFNAILRSRIAIVDPTAGVTRDRLAARVERRGRVFQLVDTGGMGLFDDTDLKAEVEHQIQVAIDHADLILFLVDAKDGLLPADEQIARRMRSLGRPVLLVANKCDGAKIEQDISSMYRLGLGDPHAVSAKERVGVEELMDAILEKLDQFDSDAVDAAAAAAADGTGPSQASATYAQSYEDFEETPAGDDEPDRPIRLSIVGKVNSGKSTLVNLLAGEERVIVSEIAGTTRDAIDVPFEWAGRQYTAVDTAGLRKRRVVEGTADFYGHLRAQGAIRRADVVLLLVDATRKISKIDKALAHLIARSDKPVVVGVTKWDLAKAEGREPEDYIPYVEQQLPQLDFAPVTFMSSHEGFNIGETLDVVSNLYDQSSFRAPTGPLNRVIEDAITRHGPRTTQSRVPKILYATQAGIRPPTIVVFVNDHKLFGDEYRRYLSNRLRETFPFEEVPIRIIFRTRESELRK